MIGSLVCRARGGIWDRRLCRRMQTEKDQGKYAVDFANIELSSCHRFYHITRSCRVRHFGQTGYLATRMWSPQPSMQMENHHIRPISIPILNVWQVSPFVIQKSGFLDTSSARGIARCRRVLRIQDRRGCWEKDDQSARHESRKRLLTCRRARERLEPHGKAARRDGTSNRVIADGWRSFSIGLFDWRNPLRNMKIESVCAIIEAALPTLHGLAVGLLA